MNDKDKKGTGRERRKAKIRACKGELRIDYSEVARELGITPQMVGQVAALKFISRRVVEALVARGVPAKLFLPEYPGLEAAPSPQPSPSRERGLKERAA